MAHDMPLIATLVAGFSLAFALGFLFHKLHLPLIAGFLCAGVLIGPFTPGYVADQKIATELSELGIILLMFGVGLNFSLKELISVQRVVIPAAIIQILIISALGVALGTYLGWSLTAGAIFGLGLAVASTIVSIRALQEQHLLETERGKIALGWLIVEDLLMVVALVLLPVLSQSEQSAVQGSLLSTILITLLKVASFVLVMMFVGRKIIPWLLHHVAHTGSRELFRLSVLTVSIGVAFGASQLFGVSLALGAFFAGLVLSESQLAAQAAKDTLPFRDAFAVLFFVSVGMMVRPGVVMDYPLAIVMTVLIIVVGKFICTYLIIRFFSYSGHIAASIGASRAQIGEFSFILIVLAGSLLLVPSVAKDLLVFSAFISILLNPAIFKLVDMKYPSRRHEAVAVPASEITVPRATLPEEFSDAEAVLIGHGRVGGLIQQMLTAKRIKTIIIDESPVAFDPQSFPNQFKLVGIASDKEIIEQINFAKVKMLILAIPETFGAGAIIERARLENPKIWIIARVAGLEEAAYVKSRGADQVFVPESETARAMIEALSSHEFFQTPS